MVGRAGLVLGQLLNTAALCRAGFELINELRQRPAGRKQKAKTRPIRQIWRCATPGQLRRSGRGWGAKGTKVPPPHRVSRDMGTP